MASENGIRTMFLVLFAALIIGSMFLNTNAATGLNYSYYTSTTYTTSTSTSTTSTSTTIAYPIYYTTTSTTTSTTSTTQKKVCEDCGWCNAEQCHALRGKNGEKCAYDDTGLNHCHTCPTTCGGASACTHGEYMCKTECPGQCGLRCYPPVAGGAASCSKCPPTCAGFANKGDCSSNNRANCGLLCGWMATGSEAGYCTGTKV